MLERLDFPTALRYTLAGAAIVSALLYLTFSGNTALGMALALAAALLVRVLLINLGRSPDDRNTPAAGE